MKRLVFENVKINGFDGKIYREYNNYGKPTRRRYSVLCEMTDTQKETIFSSVRTSSKILKFWRGVF